MDTLTALGSQFGELAWYFKFLILSLPLVLIGFMTKDYWYSEFSYWKMKTIQRLPYFGTISKLSRSKLSVDTSTDKLWTSAETEILRPYYSYYHTALSDPEIYDKSVDYLEKVNESGSRPMPSWLLLLTVGLVLIEAVGFGFAIAPYAAINVTASQVTLLAAVGAILLAIVSCGLAHLAGEESAYNNKIKIIRSGWEKDSAKDRGPLSNRKTLAIVNTYQDNDEPETRYWKMISRRIKIKGGEVAQRYVWHIVLVGVVIGLGAMAFYLRYSALNSNLTDIAQSAGLSSASTTSSGGGIFDMTPGAESVSNQAANQSAEEQISALKQAFYTTFVIFSLVYICVQVIMYAMTAKYTLVGEHSRNAWKYTHKFSSASDLNHFLERIRVRIDGDAENALMALRRKLIGKAHEEIEQEAMQSSTCGKKTFSAFCEMASTKSAETGQRKKPVVPTVPATARSINKPIELVAVDNTDKHDSLLKEIADQENLVSLTDEELQFTLEDLQSERSAPWLTFEQLKSIRGRQLAKQKRKAGQQA